MPTINKLIFLLEFPFCLRDYNRFGIEILKKSGFSVEIWDLSRMLHDEVIQKIKIPDPILADNHRIFSAYGDVERAMGNLGDDCFIICFVHYRPASYKIYRLMSRRKLRYCVCLGGSYPIVTMNLKRRSALRAIWSKYGEKLKNKKYSSIVNKIFLLIPFRFLGIQAANIVLACGEKTHFSSFPIDANTEIMWIHYFDYDIYLEELGRTGLGYRKTAVFLDSFLPFHPEYIFSKVSHPISPEEYYPGLREFFDHVERRLCMKVVVAAHPRSNYGENENYFGNRPVIQGRTAELVRDASLVLVHSSYALNFAVLFKKPIIFLTTDKLNDSTVGMEIDTMAGIFGKRVVNIDSSAMIDLEEELKIDDARYELYKHNYIKKNGTPELPFWQVVADRIKEYS